MNKIKAVFNKPVTYFVLGAVVIVASVLCGVLPFAFRPKKGLTAAQREFIKQIAAVEMPEPQSVEFSYDTAVLTAQEEIASVHYLAQGFIVATVVNNTTETATIEIIENTQDETVRTVIASAEEYGVSVYDEDNIILYSYADNTCALYSCQNKQLVQAAGQYNAITPLANNYYLFSTNTNIVAEEYYARLTSVTIVHRSGTSITECATQDNVIKITEQENFIAINSYEKFSVYFLGDELTEEFTLDNGSEGKTIEELLEQGFKPSVNEYRIEQITEGSYYLNLTLLGSEEDYTYADEYDSATYYYKNANYKLDTEAKEITLMADQDTRYAYKQLGNGCYQEVATAPDEEETVTYYNGEGKKVAMPNLDIVHSFGDTFIATTEEGTALYNQKMEVLLDFENAAYFYFHNNLIVFVADTYGYMADSNGNLLVEESCDQITAEVNGKVLFGYYELYADENDEVTKVWTWRFIDTTTLEITKAENIDENYSNVYKLQPFYVQDKEDRYKVYDGGDAFICRNISLSRTNKGYKCLYDLGEGEYRSKEYEQNNSTVTIRLNGSEEKSEEETSEKLASKPSFTVKSSTAVPCTIYVRVGKQKDKTTTTDCYSSTVTVEQQEVKGGWADIRNLEISALKSSIYAFSLSNGSKTLISSYGIGNSVPSKEIMFLSYRYPYLNVDRIYVLYFDGDRYDDKNKLAHSDIANAILGYGYQVNNGHDDMCINGNSYYYESDPFMLINAKDYDGFHWEKYGNWKDNVTSLGLSYLKTKSITSSVVYVDPVKRAVRIHTNGGTISGMTAKYDNGDYEKSYYYGLKYNHSHNGSDANLPSKDKMSKENHVFEGWYSDAAFTNKITDSSFSIYSDIYAKWIPNYNVTFDLNVNTGSEKITGAINTAIVTPSRNGGSTQTYVKTALTYERECLPSQDPTCTAYEFDGWYTEKSGGTKITGSDVAPTLADHTLYAHWSPIEYTITLETSRTYGYYRRRTGKITGSVNYDNEEYNWYDNLSLVYDYDTVSSIPRKYTIESTSQNLMHPYQEDGYIFSHWQVKEVTNASQNGSWKVGDNYTDAGAKITGIARNKTGTEDGTKTTTAWAAGAHYGDLKLTAVFEVPIYYKSASSSNKLGYYLSNDSNKTFYRTTSNAKTINLSGGLVLNRNGYFTAKYTYGSDSLRVNWEENSLYVHPSDNSASKIAPFSATYNNEDGYSITVTSAEDQTYTYTKPIIISFDYYALNYKVNGISEDWEKLCVPQNLSSYALVKDWLDSSIIGSETFTYEVGEYDDQFENALVDELKFSDLGGASSNVYTKKVIATRKVVLNFNCVGGQNTFLSDAEKTITTDWGVQLQDLDIYKKWNSECVNNPYFYLYINNSRIFKSGNNYYEFTGITVSGRTDALVSTTAFETNQSLQLNFKSYTLPDRVQVGTYRYNSSEDNGMEYKNAVIYNSSNKAIVEIKDVTRTISIDGETRTITIKDVFYANGMALDCIPQVKLPEGTFLPIGVLSSNEQMYDFSDILIQGVPAQKKVTVEKPTDNKTVYIYIVYQRTGD